MSPKHIRIGAALLGLLALILVVQTIRWSGESGAERAHQKFLDHVADRRWGKCQRMISTSYSDRWGFGRNDISLALKDVGSQFVISLLIGWETEAIEEVEGAFEIVGKMDIDGRGGPAVELILAEARRYTSRPFTFHWKREGLLPWKWKLQSIDHPTVEVPPGYTPGDLGSITSPF